MDCTRPDRHYAGFVKTSTTEAKSPEFNAILKQIKAGQERERQERRKGRPPSVKETKLTELKLQEAEEYRTGMGVSPVFPFLMWLF